jgi:hypothetical protein
MENKEDFVDLELFKVNGVKLIARTYTNGKKVWIIKRNYLLFWWIWKTVFEKDFD